MGEDLWKNLEGTESESRYKPRLHIIHSHIGDIRNVDMYEIYYMSWVMLGSLISPPGSSHENKGVCQLLGVLFLKKSAPWLLE